MPKVGRMPDEQKEISDELRRLYGGMMTLENIRSEIGAKHPDTARKWACTIPTFEVNGRKKYRVCDVAKRIYEART